MISNMLNDINYLRLISDICPNNPSLDVCKNISEENYVIMKPHDIILSNVFDNKKVDFVVISDRGGSGKTYGIGYYLYYEYHKRQYVKRPVYAIYSIIKNDFSYIQGWPRIKIMLSSLNLKENEMSLDSVLNYLSSLKGDYDVPALTHLVIDNVNNLESINKIYRLYRSIFSNNRLNPVKIYILTRIKRKKVRRLLESNGLTKNTISFSPTKYEKNNASICLFYDWNTDHKLALCKMRYDEYSYIEFISKLSSKLNQCTNSNLCALLESYENGIVAAMGLLSKISPTLIVDRLRYLVLDINNMKYEDFLDRLKSIIYEYPFPLALINGIIPHYFVRNNLYDISKNLLNLFKYKYLKNKYKISSINSISLNLDKLIPLNLVLVNRNELYSIGFTQTKRNVEILIKKSKLFIDNLLGNRYFSKIVILISFYKKRKWLESYAKKIVQDRNINLEFMYLDNTEVLSLIKNITPYI
ncbi:MAG: hypothetical protein RXR43_13075 [Sulfolobus sp.]